MSALEKNVKVSTPGRICLFGEHQDYLNLPVIAAAISKRVKIVGTKKSGNKIFINLPDINKHEEFQLSEKIPYSKERDYLRSSVNLMLRNGFTFSSGFECEITGKIPINTGTASSSALVVSWINFLARISDQEKILSNYEIAELAHESEVVEFSEPGGMMDHYSTALGGIIYLKTFPKINVQKLNCNLGSFILGNSEEPKNTTDILARVKNGVLNIASRLKQKYPDFDLQVLSDESLKNFENDLNEQELKLLFATLRNKKITQEAHSLMNSNKCDEEKFGILLNDHQKMLRDYLKISTNKIDRMLNAALDAGALGGKINGSGGGGCMFAYAPFDTEKVLNAVKRIAPDSHIVNIDEGTRLEFNGEKI